MTQKTIIKVLKVSCWSAANYFSAHSIAWQEFPKGNKRPQDVLGPVIGLSLRLLALLSQKESSLPSVVTSV